MADRDDLPPELADAADTIDAFVRATLASLPRTRPDEVWAALLSILQGIVDSPVQAKILQGLLDGARGHADRAALFVVRKGRASGWAAEGFDGDPVQDEIREVHIDLEQDTVFREVVRSRRSIAEDDPASGSLSFLRFGQTEPRAAVYVPLCAGDRVVGVLYADVVGADRELGRAALETLALASSLAVERLLLRGKLAGSVAPRPASPAATGGFPARRPTPEEGHRPEPEPLSFSLDLPAAGALRGGGPAPEEDAQRFARLLATEIKLYHEQEVAAGRLTGDLYSRLREPIESSRRLYLERVESLALERDFFEEEVVEVLAGGNPALLGPR